eukprot:231458_1
MHTGLYVQFVESRKAFEEKLQAQREIFEQSLVVDYRERMSSEMQIKRAEMVERADVPEVTETNASTRSHPDPTYKGAAVLMKEKKSVPTPVKTNPLKQLANVFGFATE